MKTTMPNSDKSARAQRRAAERRKKRMDGDVKKLLREAEEAEMAKLIAGAQPPGPASRTAPVLMVTMNTPEGEKSVPVELATLMILGEARDILKEVAASLQRLVDVAEYPSRKMEMVSESLHAALVAEQAKNEPTSS